MNVAPVTIDLSKLAPGQQISVEWRQKSVFILHRTRSMLERLNTQGHLTQLRDPYSDVGTQQPDYVQNEVRSLSNEYLIVVGRCTHLGCVPSFRPGATYGVLSPDWEGGYYCPCHGSRFDLAGRVFKGVPAPTNLEIPPYRYLSDSIVEIGVDSNWCTSQGLS